MEDVADLVFIIFISVILVIGFLLNCCILMVYWKQKCFQTPVYIYIKNLAFCMLLTGGLILPQRLHDFTHQDNYFEGTLLCKLINFLPAFCLFIQIAFIWIISVERLIKTTRVSATVNPSHNSENFRKEKSQARKISVACWLMGLLVAIPTLVFFDIFYVLIEDDSGFRSGYSGSNVSYFSPEYNICQSDYLYDEDNDSQLLYINNSRLETAKRALSNILWNISSKIPQSLDIAKYRIHKFKYVNTRLAHSERSHTYFFKALDYITYGAVMNNKLCGLASIEKSFTLIEGPEKLLNDSFSSVSSWAGDYEFLIGCNYVTSHQTIIKYTIFSLVFLFVLPGISIFVNYALLSRFLIKSSLTYRQVKRRSFIRMICMICESDSNNKADKKNRVDLNVNPTNISNNAANLNNRSDYNLRTDIEPSIIDQVRSHRINSSNIIAMKSCEIRRNVNLNMPERKGNAIKSLFYISLTYCLTWLPFFIVFTIEVIKNIDSI
ncbi:unnamed protein product [Gordionus sp. m RMFG-2023]